MDVRLRHLLRSRHSRIAAASSFLNTVSLIRVTETIGNRTKENPSRIRLSYWTHEGEMIAMIDPIYEVQYKRLEQ